MKSFFLSSLLFLSFLSSGYALAKEDLKKKPAAIAQANRFFRDADQDGRGNAAQDTLAEIQPAGYVSDSSDCNDANPLVFRQTAKPKILLAGGGNQFCPGESALLLLEQPDSLIFYSWTNGEAAVGLVSITTDSAAAWQVTALADSGCPAASDTFQLILSTSLAPTAQISVFPSASICTGTLTTFSQNITGGGSDPFYEWYVNDLFVSVGSSYQTDSLKEGDEVQLILTSSAFCADPVVALSPKITMHVQDSLQAFAGTDFNVCGDAAVLQANAFGTWSLLSGSGSFNDPDTAQTLVSGLSPGINRLVWTISGGTCPESRDTLEIFAVPLLAASAGADRIICSASGVLQGNGQPGQGSWRILSGNLQLSDSLDPASLFSGFETGSCLLEWKISDGVCPESRDTVLLSRIAGPSAALAGNDTVACISSSILSAQLPENGTGRWRVISGSGLVTDSLSAQSPVQNLAPGINELEWRVSLSACPSNADTLRITRYESNLNLGSDTLVCQGDSVTLSLDNSFQNIIWSDGSSGNSFTIDSAGTYFVQANGIGGCLWTDSIQIQYQVCTFSAPLEDEKDKVSVWPNPFHGAFVLHFSGKMEKYNRLRIISPAGQVVYEQEIRQESRDLPINAGIAPGLYFLELQGNSDRLMHQIISGY